MTMSEAFPQGKTGNGIFTALSLLTVPWSDDYAANLLDITYFNIHSGLKEVSPLISNFVIENVLPVESYATIASIIKSYYSKKWIKLYSTLNLTYNPIHNYDMVESMTEDYSKSNSNEAQEKTTHGHTISDDIEGTNSLTHGESISKTENVDNDSEMNQTDTITHNTEKETVISGAANQNNNTFGFNSASAVPLTTQAGTNNQTGTETNTGTDTTVTQKAETLSTDTTATEAHTGVDATVEARTAVESHSGIDLIENDGTITETGGGGHELTRSGNIGVTTTQQMIKAEREIWLWNFFEQVFSDVDNLLTLKIY